MIPSVFVRELDSASGLAVLTAEQARHVSRVLRLGPGDRIRVMDGRGQGFEGEIVGSGRALSVKLGTRLSLQTESPLRITLIQGLPKGEKMDWIVEKCTELGVSEIRPVIAERSQNRGAGRADRWKRIAESAAAQSGRAFVPEVFEPEPLDAALSKAPRAGFVFWEEGGAKLNGKPPCPADAMGILVGPEGGLTADEVGRAESHGFKRAGLGPRILRTETAALVAVGMVQYVYGDLGQGKPETGRIAGND